MAGISRGAGGLGVKVLTGTSNPYVDPSPFGRGRVVDANRICGLTASCRWIAVGMNFHAVDHLACGIGRGNMDGPLRGRGGQCTLCGDDGRIRTAFGMRDVHVSSCNTDGAPQN